MVTTLVLGVALFAGPSVADVGVNTVSITDVTVVEGDSPGTTDAVFTVTLSPADSDSATTVNYSTADGTATGGSDYTSVAGGTVVFEIDDTEEQITISVLRDNLDEIDEEAFAVNLSSSDADIATGDAGVGTGTITDDDGPPSASIGPASATEGGDLSFPVTLSTASGRPVTVNYSTSNGSAVAPGDYDAVTGGSIVIASGTSGTITISSNEDTLDEANETFTVTLAASTTATVGSPGSATGTINDNDSEPALSISNVTQAEGNSGITTFVFTVSLTPASGRTVTVNFATRNGTAIADGLGSANDYAATSGSRTFNAGDTTETISVTVNGDTFNEGAENFFVDLSGATNASLPATPFGTGTISNDDVQPSLSVENKTVNEGVGTATFAVTLAPSSGQTVQVNYAINDGSATSPADYGDSSNLLSFAPGETTKTIFVPIVQDTLDEADTETFTISLSNESNAVVSPAERDSTEGIADDDPAPSVSIESAPAVTEGGVASFPVTLSAASGRGVSVQYTTSNGTAAAPGDFGSATNATLTFAPGETSKPIQIQTNDDTLDEPDTENFTVTISAPTNATLGSPASGTGTINDNDAQPSVSIGNAPAVTEGGTASFPVTLSAASGRTVTVNYATAHGTTEAADLAGATSGTVTFAPGDPLTKQISIATVDDAFDEADAETFTVTLSGPTNATLGTPSGTGTINDNDGSPTVSIGNAPAVTEGATASFPVTLSAASGRTVTVNYATTHGTTAAADLSGALTGTVTFAPGEPLTKQVAIATVDDPLDEADTETFTVTLSAPSNATLGTPSAGTGTINDNDALPTLSVSDANALEGNSGGLPACGAPPAPGANPTGFTSFTVSLSPASGRTVTVQWSTADNTAVAPDDYASVSPTTLTFAPGGALSQTVCVRIVGDVSDEPNQSFNVVLTGPTNATLVDGTGVGTILDDDGEPALTVSGASDPEGGGPARFVVSLLPSSGNTVTVNLSTVGGSAISGTDFTAIPAAVFPPPPAGCSANPCALTFTPGQTSKAIDINLVDDLLDENDETFTVSLSNEVNARIVNGNDRFGIVTILDNDALPSVSIGDATVTEGDGGTVNASFQVTLSPASGRAVSINYASANGSAVAPEDYAAAAGSLSFAPGETSKTVVVPVNGDTSVEADETFAVGISGPVNVTIADGQAVGTIVNDDASPPPPPPPPPEPPPPTSTTTTTTTGPTTSTTTTVPRPPPPPPPRTFDGMRISQAPVTLFDDLAPIGVTCSRRATGTCTGTVVVKGQVRVLAIVNGRPSAKAVTLGRESFAIPRGRTEKVLVSLNRRALKAVKRAGRLKVTVVVTARDSARKRAKQVSRALWLRTAKAPKKTKTSAARR